MFSSPAIVIVILMIIAHSDAHCVGTINEFAFLSTNKQKSKFRNFRKLFLKRHFEKQKTDTESCTSSSRLTYDIWLWINVRQQRSRRRQLRERVQRSSSQAWRAHNRERRRESESSVGASLCYFAALCLSLCLRSLARVCTMRCLAECIFNSMVGVADAHFANWNVYKPGEQLPQYSLLFTFASGLVSSGRSGVWFGPQRTNERKNTQYSLWGDRWA